MCNKSFPALTRTHPGSAGPALVTESEDEDNDEEGQDDGEDDAHVVVGLERQKERFSGRAHSPAFLAFGGVCCVEVTHLGGFTLILI